MKLLRFFALLFLLSSSALAQTVAVSATLTDGQGNPVPGAYLHFELYNCGTNFPTVTGPGIAIVQKSFDLQPNSAGVIGGVVEPNDLIKCGNVSSTLWTVQLMASGATPLNAALRYNICSSTETGPTCAQAGGPGAVFNPATAQPAQISGSLVNYIPGPPGYILLLSNAPNSQTWVQPPGTAATFTGNFLFNDGIFSGPVFVAQLPTLNANFVYVSDATPGSSPCTGGGTGSPAFYVNGIWECALGNSGPSGSSFTGSVGRIPLFTSTTGGGNSCLADSNTGSGGSIFNACGTENFNLGSFQTVTYPAIVNLNTLNATIASIGTLTLNNFVFNGPAAITTACPSVAPANPAAGHAELAILYPSCLFGEFPGGGTAFYNFPMQYANFPIGGKVAASGLNTLFGDAAEFDCSAPGYAGSDNGYSIQNCEAANTTYGSALDARGFQGLWSMANTSIMSLFSASYGGPMQLGDAQIRPSNGVGIPRGTMLFGSGWEGATVQPYDGATVLQATNIPINTPLLGYTDDNLTFNFNASPVFDAPVTEMTLDCASVAGCIGFADYVGQEGTGLFRSNSLGFGNGGIGLNIGGADVAVTPGTPNNSYGSATVCNSSTCSITLPNAQVAGNLIAICARWAPYTVTLESAANSTTNDSYSTVANTAVVDGTLEGGGCVYSPNVNAGSGTITLTFSGTVTTNTLYVAAIEIPNVNGLDVANHAVSTTHGPGPTVTTTNSSTVNPDDSIVGVALTGSNSSTWAAGSGFTSLVATGTVGLEYQTQTTDGNYDTTWVSTNTNHTLMFTLAFTSGTNNGPGAQNSWFEGLDFSLGTGTTITRSAKCININTGSPGNAGPKELANVTCTAQGAASAPPNVLMSVGGSHSTFRNMHFENAGIAAVTLGFAEGANSESFININSGNLNVPLSFTITGASESGNTATYTTSASCSGLNAGQPITITGLTGQTGYNQASSQLVPFTVATTCTGTSFTAVLTAGSLTTISGQSGTVAAQNSLIKISDNNPNSTGGLFFANLSAAGPNLPALLVDDELNGNYIPTSAEAYLSLYALGAPASRQPGAGAGENLLTTSGQVASDVWKMSTQLDATDYQGIANHGDGQAGGATQPPAKDGFFTVPATWQQIVVSSNAVQGPGSVILLDDDPASVSLYGGTPAACNTTQFLGWKIVAKQGPLTPYPNFTAYPVDAVTSASLTSNVTTLTVASPLGSSFPVGSIIRHAGDSNANLDVLGLVTGNSATTIVYAQILGNTTGTGGTVQIVPGFAVALSAAVSTTPECYSYHIRD